jgi:hypothetical protein
MPRTGDKCTSIGKYKSDCGHWTVDMKKVGDEFPPCPHCHRAVNYTKA